MVGKLMEVLNSFKYLRSCFYNEERPEENLKVRVGEGLKNIMSIEDDV